MKISEIQNLQMQDLIRMSEEELKRLVSSMAKVLNPRINRLANAGAEQGKIAKDAYDYVMDSGGLFTTTGDDMRINNQGEFTYTKTRNELLKEANRGIYFSNLKTGTVRGARAEKLRREEGVRAKVNVKDYTQDEIDDMVSDYWDEFHRYRENAPNIGSPRLYKIYKKYEGTQPEKIQKEIDKINKKIQRKIEVAYEEAIKETGYNPKWEF